MPNPKPWLSRRAAVLVFLIAAVLIPGLVTAAYAASVRGVRDDIASGTAASQATSTTAPLVVPGTQTATASPDLVMSMADRSTVQRQINHLIMARPIVFVPNSAALTPASVATVAQIADVLRSTPTVQIEVDGHVASTPGRDPDPKVLSDSRALVVRVQLVSLGVAADRITAVGFGDTMPIERNTTAQGRAANRRAEIVVR